MIARLALPAALIFASVAGAQAPPVAAPPVPVSPAHDTAAPRPRYGSWGVDYADMDRSVRPGDDFFAFAEGTWLTTNPIPADKTGAGYNYELPDEAERQVRTIVEDAQGRRADAAARRIGDVYAAWMDEPGIERRGLAPLRPYLARIDAVRTRSDLVRLMAQPGYAAPISFDIERDPEDPTRYIGNTGQARLGLPSRDYYLLPGAEYVGYRRAYRAYIARLFALAGIAGGDAKAVAIIALETRLSRDQWTPERRRDPVATHNPMTRAQLSRLAPEFEWPAALAAAGFGPLAIFNVDEPSAVRAAGRRIADVPLATWKAYLAFRFISRFAAFLPKAFDDAHFAFYDHRLFGVPEQRERWKRGIALLNADLGEAVGQLYVERHWSAATAAQADELVADMRAAYHDKIEHAAWMDAPTRAAALAKLATFDPRIGHPAKYVDYSSMRVSRSDPLGNAIAAVRFRRDYDLARMTEPVDRSLWEMNPQEVNAYYEPTTNQITLPAAELQPPFFDAAADPAVNYGETGASTIGHEMGHGYDDAGRQYDAHGRLADWWSASTAARYKVKAEMLATQYDAYEPIPGVHINGHLTLGENLADLGGVETAYAAYRRYVSRHGEPPVIDGYTGDQRFFLAFAQAWQGKTREGALRAQLLSDPHSPEKYRVNGVLRNVDAWYAAFSVKPGDAMYLAPEQRVHLW